MEVEVSKAMFDEVKAAVADIRNGYKNVLVTSINKTAGTAKVQIAARVGNEINLKAARIKENLTVQKANYSKMSGAVVSKGEPIGLINFGARDSVKGVSVQVLKSSSRTLLKHAFIAKGTGRSISRSTGEVKYHVFWRKGRDKMPAAKRFPVGKKSNAPWPKFGDKYRFKIKRLTGPRIEDIFGKDKVLEPVMIQANHLFLRNVDSKITDILRRHAGGINIG